MAPLLEVSDSEMTMTSGSEELCLAENWSTRRIEMLFPEVLKGVHPGLKNDICVASDPFTPLKPLNATTFELNADGEGSPFPDFLMFMRGWTLHGTCFTLGVCNGALQNVAPAWGRKAVRAGRKIVTDIMGLDAGQHQGGAVGTIGLDIGWDFLLPILFVLFGIFLEFMIEITPFGLSTYNLGFSLATETIRAVEEAAILRMEEEEPNDNIL